MSSSCQLRPGKTTPSSLLLIPFKVQSARVYFSLFFFWNFSVNFGYFTYRDQISASVASYTKNYLRVAALLHLIGIYIYCRSKERRYAWIMMKASESKISQRNFPSWLLRLHFSFHFKCYIHKGSVEVLCCVCSRQLAHFSYYCSLLAEQSGADRGFEMRPSITWESPT